MKKINKTTIKMLSIIGILIIFLASLVIAGIQVGIPGKIGLDFSIKPDLWCRLTGCSISGALTLENLSGVDNAFACLDSDGKLYRSAVSCN